MTVKRNFYVHDCLRSVKSAKNAVEFMHQLRSSKGEFRLTEWLSNSSEVLDCILRVERAPSVLGLDLDKDLDVGLKFTAVKRVKFEKVKRNTSKLRLLLSLSKV